MSSDNPPSLSKLPAELIYRMLDNLASDDIFLAAYNVCVRLNSIIDTYAPYQVTLTDRLSLGTPISWSFSSGRDLSSTPMESIGRCRSKTSGRCIEIQSGKMTTLKMSSNMMSEERANYLKAVLDDNKVNWGNFAVCTTNYFISVGLLVQGTMKDDWD